MRLAPWSKGLLHHCYAPRASLHICLPACSSYAVNKSRVRFFLHDSTLYFIKTSHSIKSTTSELEMADLLINFNLLATAKNVCERKKTGLRKEEKHSRTLVLLPRRCLVHGDSSKHQNDTGMTELQAKCFQNNK